MDFETYLEHRGLRYDKTVRVNGGLPASGPGGWLIARPVVVKGQMGYAICVLPARCTLNLQWVAEVLQELDVRVVPAPEAQDVLGRERCGGSALRTIVDERLGSQDVIVMQSNGPEVSLCIRRRDMDRLFHPIVAEIAC